MKVEIITIRDEILLGQIVDSNSAWIGTQLNLIGAQVSRVRSISDTKTDISSNLKSALRDADIVLITGGLGPTKDDVTKATLCDFFDDHLIVHEPTLRRVQHFFEERGLPFTETNKKQAEVPSKCRVLENEKGTAPGMLFEFDGKAVVSMPGVPAEMKFLMTSYILPKIKSEYKLPKRIHKTILTNGIGESFLSDMIEEWELGLKVQGISLAYLPSLGGVRLRLSGESEKENLSDKMDAEIDKLQELIPNYFLGIEEYGKSRLSIEDILAKKLLEKKLTLSLAESCTGGYVSSLLTAIPGSSAFYNGTVVAYSYDVKENILDVNQGDLNKYGAVSKQVVEQMAQNV